MMEQNRGIQPAAEQNAQRHPAARLAGDRLLDQIRLTDTQITDALKTLADNIEYDQFLELIKKNKAPFYLHSKEENQDVGILAAIYRIYVENWSFEKTIIEYGRIGGSLKDDDRLLRAIMKKEQ